MKKIAIAILALAAAAAGIWRWRGGKASASDSDARQATAQRGSIEETVQATGSVLPLNRVEIKPPISGRIEKLLVDEGDAVKAGQIIAWMSSDDRAAILDAARAEGPEKLKQWQDDYKPAPIVAPLSGVVILRNVVVGQTVDASTVLYAMSDVLVVIAQVDESDIGRVRLGMPARVVLDAYPDKSAEGKVFDILYEGRNVSNVITYNVKIKLDRVPPFYRSQMTANVDFLVRRKDDAVLVPSAAVRESEGRKTVLVPGPDGQPAPREVETGIEGDGKTEIVSGLRAGDPIVITQARYVPQEAPQSSPLTMGGKPPSSSRGGRNKK